MEYACTSFMLMVIRDITKDEKDFVIFTTVQIEDVSTLFPSGQLNISKYKSFPN